MIDTFLEDNYKFSKNRILDFYKEYDCNSHFIYDCDDLENNKASILNRSAHEDSFVNIVTESMLDEKCVFFSEKTFKPIYSIQPFILVSNPYSLKKLKEMGYKTFGKWWDESYDEETNFTRRFEKIIEIMIEISSWSIEKCFKITNEMEEVLLHNYHRMISDKDTIDFYNLINQGSIRNYYDLSNKNLEIKKIFKLI
jgi:hypothetical protein